MGGEDEAMEYRIKKEGGGDYKGGPKDIPFSWKLTLVAMQVGGVRASVHTV